MEIGSRNNGLLLKDKVIFVTGASRGIGRAICEKFADEGGVVYAGIRNENSAGEIEFENTETGGKIIPIKLDVCEKEDIRQSIIKIKQDCGRLDVLVNNAGVTIIERFDMMRDSSLEEIYNINVFGMMHVTQMAVRLLKKSDKPVIINMSSIMAMDSDVGQTAYASSKAAVISMTKTWTKEYTPLGFRVNAIAPGNVDTDMFNIIDKNDLDKAVSKIGMGRVAKPEEIANVALFLASDMSSYVTGEVINVNGGLIL